jgi:hypothetical protein
MDDDVAAERDKLSPAGARRNLALNGTAAHGNRGTADSPLEPSFSQPLGTITRITGH